MISVAICTRNRPDLLRGTLESLVQMRETDGLQWELLLVDNGPSDDTRTVSDDFASRLPLRYVVEPVPGLAMARNRAVEEFRGDYLLWTDDDVRVEPGWLSAYADAFRRWPKAGVFGGPIRPSFEGSAPEWLKEMLPVVESAYAVRDFGPAPSELGLPSAVPYGANYAIRADLQRSRSYDTRLGFRPSRPHLRGEEIDVIGSLLEAGHTGRWVPGAAVRHWIPRERQSLRYLWTYYLGQGQRRVVDGYGATDKMILGRPRWLWRQVAERPLRLLAAFLGSGDPLLKGRELRACAVHWGMWIGV